MEKRKFSHKQNLSADAKLIVALLKKQPQSKSELCNNAGIHESTFYRVIFLLKARGIIKETMGGFALWTYIELEKDIENALDRLGENYSVITFNKIASEVGVHPSEIEPIIYGIAKKRGMEVRLEKGEKVVGKPIEGVVLF
jgi:lambda repressor-like predicted transcriptional regulator